MEPVRFDTLELVLIHQPTIPGLCEIDCLQQLLEPEFTVCLQSPAEGEAWEPPRQRLRVRSACGESFATPRSLEESVRARAGSAFRLHAIGAIRRHG